MGCALHHHSELLRSEVEAPRPQLFLVAHTKQNWEIFTQTDFAASKPAQRGKLKILPDMGIADRTAALKKLSVSPPRPTRFLRPASLASGLVFVLVRTLPDLIAFYITRSKALRAVAPA